MKQNSGTYRVGTGATSLLMILVILCLTALSVVSYTSATSELTVSRRAAQVTEKVYAAMDEGYALLAKIDEALEKTRGIATAETYLTQCAQALQALDDGLTVNGEMVTATLPATEKLALRLELRIMPLGDAAKRYELITFATVTEGEEAF